MKWDQELKRSKNTTEINVSQYLDTQKIPYKYEVPVCIIDEQNNQRIWYPDFYLPTLGVYLEVCGTEKDRLEKRRREHVNEENEIPVIFLHYYKDEVNDYWSFFEFSDLSEETETSQGITLEIISLFCLFQVN